MANRTIRLDSERCVAIRTRKGLSRDRLTEQSRGGISVATLKRIEKGEPIYLDTARRLADLLAVPLRELAPRSDDGGAGCEDPGVSASAPTIAVLPFDTVGDPAGEPVFTDGLVEDLITRLGACWFPVIARSSTFRYRGQSPELRVLRSELGADYIIEGSVRRSGDQLRVTARLASAETGLQLWAKHYDRPYGNVFALQDEIVSAIVGQVGGAILDQTVRRIPHSDPSDMNAWELSLRGAWCFHRRSREQNAEARSLLESAVRRDASLQHAWYLLAMTHQRAIINQWSSDMGRSVRELRAVCDEFARHHPNDPGLYVVSAYAAVYAGDRRTAALRLLDAIELNPNSVAAYSLYGQTLAMGNRPDEAIEQFEQAIRLSPLDSQLWSIQAALALCHFVTERYDDMLRWANLAVTSRPDMPFALGTLAVAKACAGDADGATRAARALLDLNPAMNVRGLAAVLGATDPEIAKRYLDALRRVGVPG